MTTTVPYLDLKRQHVALGAEIEEEVKRVVMSGWYLLGPETEAFEKEWAEYCGAKYCVAVGSGTDAIELSLRAMGFGVEDEVLVPALTAWGTAMGALRAGCDVHLVDVRGFPCVAPGAMDVIKYKREGRMHIPVALWGDDYCKANFGRPCILDACQRAGLILPHDTDFFKAVCCSFYPTKNLGGLGDSGAVLTNDFEIADQIRMLRRQGELIRAYSVKRVGHSRMSEVDAAVLRVKLPHLKSWTAIRQNIMARYFDVIKEIAGVRCLYQREGPHNGHVCPVYVTGDRSLFIDHMLEFGIETSIHYPVPIHRMPAAPPTWGCRVGDYPQAEDLAAHEVSLPCYPEMREDEIARVCDALKQWGERP